MSWKGSCFRPGLGSLDKLRVNMTIADGGHVINPCSTLQAACSLQPTRRTLYYYLSPSRVAAATGRSLPGRHHKLGFPTALGEQPRSQPADYLGLPEPEPR